MGAVRGKAGVDLCWKVKQKSSVMAELRAADYLLSCQDNTIDQRYFFIQMICLHLHSIGGHQLSASRQTTLNTPPLGHASCLSPLCERGETLTWNWYHNNVLSVSSVSVRSTAAPWTDRPESTTLRLQLSHPIRVTHFWWYEKPHSLSVRGLDQMLAIKTEAYGIVY